MRDFLNQTLADMRHGRESWRVFIAFCAPSSALAALIVALPRLS